MLNFLESNRSKKIMLILAAYSMIQVLAQDLGIKTGKKQAELVRFLPIQIAILFASAWTVTEDTNLAMITVGIYYFLKYVYSKGITSPVCFESV